MKRVPILCPVESLAACICTREGYKGIADRCSGRALAKCIDLNVRMVQSCGRCFSGLRVDEHSKILLVYNCLSCIPMWRYLLGEGTPFHLGFQRVNLVIRPGRDGRGPLGLGEDLPMPVALRISFEFTGELRPYSFVRSVWTGYPFSVFVFHRAWTDTSTGIPLQILDELPTSGTQYLRASREYF